VLERFGPFTFELAIGADADGLRLKIVAGRLGLLPLPRALLPRSAACEFVDDAGRFRFDVPISLPIFGLVVHYSGWLAPAVSAPAVHSPAAAVDAAPSQEHQLSRLPPS
jgi:Domain of unknown function (DUF4166)